MGRLWPKRYSAKGIKSITMLAAAEPEMLSLIPGVGETMAKQWIEDAGKLLDQRGKQQENLRLQYGEI